MPVTHVLICLYFVSILVLPKKINQKLYYFFKIIKNPEILFFDEPTTGLDSFIAQSLVNIKILRLN